MRLELCLILLWIGGNLGGRKDRRRQEDGEERGGEGRRGDDSSEDEGRERSSRGLVPQLLPNYTVPELPPPSDVGCSYAFMSCAYRDGCGTALQQYELTCGELSSGVTTTCSRSCQHALVALLSTPEGGRLMQCRCENTDCELKKQRIEPCRAAVTWQSSPASQVSCSAATWICLADPLCATALDYYNRNCQAMFKGRKCSKKCRNSLDILLRQESAGKLATCFCDGTEDFECATIRENTDTLCFGKKKEVVKDQEKEQEELDNTIDGSSSSGTGRRPLLVAVVSVILSYLIPDTIGALRDLLTVSL